jgi:ribosomal protein S18 acetylase RimI-like enzyme
MLVEDLDTANRLCIAAYATPKAPMGEFKQELGQYLRMQPDGWYFVCKNGEEVGVGGMVNYGLFAYIGMIAVDPTMQRRGVGRAIMQHLLDWQREQECPCAVLDATGAGAGLYRQLGFRDAGTTLTFRLSEELVQTGFAVTRSSTAKISVLAQAELPELVEFDMRYFGAKRHKVLETFSTDYPSRLQVARDERGEIVGYVLAQPDCLGPWIASTAEIAEDLLRAALRLPFESVPRLRVPAENEVALELVKRAGFQQVRSFQHMQYGESSVASRFDGMYALASLAIG